MANNYGLTNAQMVDFLGLPADIITKIQTAQGEEFRAVSNEFLTALVNKIVYQSVDSMTFTNPFKKFDGRPINYGETIENIFVEMPEGYKFNPNATNPFAKKNPSVKTLYASINYDMQYKVTIQDALLRKAVLNEYGFMNLIDTILSQLQKRVSLDEYFATLTMLNNENIYAAGFEEIERGATEEETAKKVTKLIVNTMSRFTLPGNGNNALGVLQTSRKEDVLLIIKAELLNSINLDYLAGVYNLSKVELLSQIIPVDSFQTTNASGDIVGEDIDFVMLDTKGFDIHTNLQDGGMIYNPEGKYTNHFANLWKVLSFKYFYNAMAFKLVEPVQQTEAVTTND